MNLTDKKFRNNTTGEVVKVIDSFENVAILENKVKIDSRKLMDPNFFTEHIDPLAFFDNQASYNNLFEKIKTISTENIPDDTGGVRTSIVQDDSFKPLDNDSAVIYSTLEDEKQELARKYGVDLNNQAVLKQNEAFAKLLEDSDEGNELPVVQPTTNHVQPVIPDEVQRIDIARNVEGQVETPIQKREDPIYTMFRGVKRPLEFNIDLKIEQKIPRLDFIEMMEDSYERSIIDFLANEFTNNLLNDPGLIRGLITKKIRELVYGEEKEEVIVPVKKPRVSRKPKTEEVKAPVKAAAKRTPKKKTEI